MSGEIVIVLLAVLAIGYVRLTTLGRPIPQPVLEEIVEEIDAQEERELIAQFHALELYTPEEADEILTRMIEEEEREMQRRRELDMELQMQGASLALAARMAALDVYRTYDVVDVDGDGLLVPPPGRLETFVRSGAAYVSGPWTGY